jgi:hypothetical protein
MSKDRPTLPREVIQLSSLRALAENETLTIQVRSGEGRDFSTGQRGRKLSISVRPWLGDEVADRVFLGLDQGDTDGFTAWLKVVKAIETLQRKGPPEGEVVN